MILLMLGAAAAAALLLSACGGDDSGGKTSGAGEGANASDGGDCKQVDQPAPRQVKNRKPPTFELARDKTYTATIETSCGTFAIRLDSKRAPRTGGSFVTLARENFFDGLTFHRIVAGFVIQGGDPRGDGTGDPGFKVRERPPPDTVYSEGVAAMAKAGNEPPGTSGSQFFVVTAVDSGLEPEYALLGKVTSGLDVVKKIGSAQTNAQEQPLSPIVIEDVKITAE
jgi:peptidyl-prolyl cis-trans isomerase B (cyclophilin B)